MTKLIEFTNSKGEVLRGLINEAKSDEGVIFVHGFERSTVEAKFKNIVDKLTGQKSLFRFDFSGCGLSDGDFKDITIAKMTDDLDSYISHIKIIYPNIKTFSFVGHSAECAIILNLLTSKEISFNKLIFLAPALNQKGLQRFWFTKSKLYKENKTLDVTWSNYKDFLDEKEFLIYCETEIRPMKEHYISNSYFLETKDQDLQDLLQRLNPQDILIIHSLLDTSVPYYSNDRLPPEIRKLKLEKGDHHLEFPPVVETYLEELINFLNSSNSTIVSETSTSTSQS